MGSTSYARDLGIAYCGQSPAELSILIEKRKRELGRPIEPFASERQKAYARELGISFHPDIGTTCLSILIDEAKEARQEDARGPRLIDASIEQVLEVLSAKLTQGVGIVLFSPHDARDIEDADDIRAGRLPMELNLSANLPEQCVEALEEALGVSVSTY